MFHNVILPCAQTIHCQYVTRHKIPGEGGWGGVVTVGGGGMGDVLGGVELPVIGEE